MADKTGGQAFPIQGLTGLPSGETVWPEPGMTLRDYFAAAALKGLIAAGTNGDVSDGTWTFPRLRSRVAYEYADAMIEERGNG